MRTPIALSLLALAVTAAAAAHAGSITMTVTDRDGKPVSDAVVIVSPSVHAAPKTPLPTQLRIVQEKMQFVPAVTIAPVGAHIVFANNDRWEHHIRGSAAGFAQFAAGDVGGFEMRFDGKVDGKPAPQNEVVVDKPGPVLLGCYIHSSMRGFVYVTDSPWSAKTGADGTAVFDDVPDGAASIRVWYAEQLLDLPAQSVTVGATPVKATAQLQVVPRRRRI